MTIDTISIGSLAQMLEPYMDKPAWPKLDNPAAKRRAVDYAKRYGLWDKLSESVNPQEPLYLMRRSLFREFRRIGRRSLSDAAMSKDAGKLEASAMALWLEHPSADLDDLQDRLWAFCDHHTWIMSPHEYCTVDLRSSSIASLLSEILWMFRDRIEDEVRERVRAEVQRRVLDPAFDYRTADGWRTNDMNWNAVCNANVISAALYHFADDVHLLAAYLQPVIPRLQFAIDGFLDDGSCREGTGYWGYGFGHIVDAAIALHHRTGGKLNLMADEKMERICRFPLATHIENGLCACFGDGGHGFISGNIALRINQFHTIPELYNISQRREDGSLSISGWRSLVLYNGQKAGKPDLLDYHLPELGFAKVRVKTDTPHPVTLAALAGQNDFPHNHNDVGTFMYCRNGILFLTDPGSPPYTGKTFGPQRYDIIQCRSLGHSVPLINEREQPPGGQYRGTMKVDGLNGSGAKTVTIDMTRAYDDPTLKSLVRTFVLNTDGSLDITDRFEFDTAPAALKEVFITQQTAEPVDGGRAVRIGSGNDTAMLQSVDTQGAFEVEDLGDESKGKRSEDTIKRIIFTPAKLEKVMTLRARIA